MGRHCIARIGLFAAACLLAWPLPLRADPPPQSAVSVRSASGLCLTVRAPVAPGAGLVLATCDGRAEQRFTYLHLGPRQGELVAPGGFNVSARLALTRSTATPLRPDSRLTLAGRCASDAAAPRITLGACVPGEPTQQWSLVY